MTGDFHQYGELMSKTPSGNFIVFIIFDMSDEVYWVKNLSFTG